MTDPLGNNGENIPGLPEAFSIADFETPAQTLLREDFDHIAELNMHAIAEFDPQGTMSPEEELTLWSTFTEVQDAEPSVARQYHKAMLQKCGLEFTLLEADDPTLIFQRAYDNAEILQIKRILRTDGTSVALKTYVDQDGGMINIALLNDEYAVEEAAHRTAAIEKNRAVSALAHHLKVDEEEMEAFKEKAGEMDTPDLQAMLKELQTSEVATGDEEFDQQLNSSAHRFSMQVTYTDGAIRKARKRYAKAAMPASGLLDDFMKKRVATRAMEYGKLVETNLQALEYNEDHVEQELAKEQALRHAELNKRLRRRKIISAAGVTAFTGVVDAVSIAAPTGIGYLGELHLDTTSGAILGSAIALGVTIRQFFVSRKQLRSAARFSQESTTDPHAPLPEQLSAEIEQGGYNAHIVRNIST